jgi:hypothetical protein
MGVYSSATVRVRAAQLLICAPALFLFLGTVCKTSVHFLICAPAPVLFLVAVRKTSAQFLIVAPTLVLLLGSVCKTSTHSLSGLHGRYVSGAILVRALTAEESENSGGAAGRSPILTPQGGN